MADARPKAKHFFPRSRVKRLDVWEALEESFVVGHRRSHARLLQHNFRQPNAIRILGVPPGQIALMLAKPSQQLLPKRSEPVTRQHSPAYSRTTLGFP